MAIDFNKPVQTRDGRKVRVLCTDAKGDEPIIALVLYINGVEGLHRFGADGGYFAGSDQADELDLVNVPESVVRWGNVYLDGVGVLLDSRRGADGIPHQGRLAVLRITYEDGKPVSVALEDV